MGSDALGEPGLDEAAIASTLRDRYGVMAASIDFLAIDHDPNAAPYRIVTVDGTRYFLKVRFGPVSEVGLQVPAALIELGVPNIVAPLRTLTSDLWASLDGHPRYSLVLFPFISGENAKVGGLSEDQWRQFGSSLRAVHGIDLDINERLRDLLAVETFALPSSAKVRRLLTLVERATFESPAAGQLAEFWLANAGRIRQLLSRAADLGDKLRAMPVEGVLCHGDIHSANVLVRDDGRIFLTDWDGPPEPLIAPRERDLMFIVDSRIGRPVERHEEDRFFEGYGPVVVDPIALAYFRDERIVQDIGEYGEGVFLARDMGEDIRALEAERLVQFFEPGGPLELAENVLGT